MLGLAEDDERRAFYLAPGAQPPYDEADAAGRRAGNRSAFLLAVGNRNSEATDSEGHSVGHSML